ncbi:MAG: hypothetical protein QXU32_06610 [Nitrososphaerales archaeon]
MSADQIIQKIIDLIHADVDLGTTDLKDVRKVYFGRLRTLPIDYPIIVVWLEEESENDDVKADTSRILYKDVIGIAVAERNTDEDAGEKNALRKAARIEVVLRANKTLDGLVADEPLPAIPKRSNPVNAEDFALTEVPMFVTYRRWEDH